MRAQSTVQPGARTRTARQIRTGLLVAAVLLAAADLAVKAAAEASLSSDTIIDLGPLNIRLLYNTGVAFSLGAALPAWVLIAATGLIIAAITWYALSSAPATTPLPRSGAALLLGGATGNFVDRLDGRGVVDYLHTGWFPTFNLADIFVTVGISLLILGTAFGKTPALDRTTT